MNSVIWYLVVVCLAGMQAAPSLEPLPVNPGGIGGLFRGPNSETIIKGPDGSQIISEQLGGAVETETKLEPIIVPDNVGDQVAVSSVSAIPIGAVDVVQQIPVGISSDVSVNPGIGLQTPLHQVDIQPVLPAVTPQLVSAASAAEPHIIETEFVDAPDIEPDQNSDLKGPSGTISVRGSSSIVSGPASTTISEPVRKIPISTVPIQPVVVQNQQQYSAEIIPAAVQAPVETILHNLPPASSGSGSVGPVPAQSTLITLDEVGIKGTVLRTDLIPPPVSSIPVAPLTFYNGVVRSSTPRNEIAPISLTGTSGAGIADATLRTDLTPPHYTIIASTQAPLQLSTINSLDLGQTVVSTTPAPISASSADIDSNRINLGQNNLQQVRISNVAPNWAVPASEGRISNAAPNWAVPTSDERISNAAPNWAVPASDGQNIIYSNETPLSSSSGPGYILGQNRDTSEGRPTSDGQNIIYSNEVPISLSSGPENILEQNRDNSRSRSNQPVTDGQNIIYSNGAPLSSSGQWYISEQNRDNSGGRPIRPLLTTAEDLRRISNIDSYSGLANRNINIQPDSSNGDVSFREQGILTNQLVSSTSRYIDSNVRDSINPYQRPVDVSVADIQSRPWLNVQPTQILPSTISPPLNDRNHGSPVASYVDSVLVQPTDPRNREIIEFGGKQLENIGNIVPVLQHPVLVAGDLNSIQQIPTASISQLSSRNELDAGVSNRYGRNAPKTT